MTASLPRADVAPATLWEILEMSVDAHERGLHHLSGSLYKMWLDRRDQFGMPVKRKKKKCA